MKKILVILLLFLTGCSSLKTEYINEPDTEAPIIRLIGQDKVEINQGWDYNELGAVVVDNRDYTLEVQISGTVDNFTPGEYTITYNAVDSSGNVAETMYRTVVVAQSEFSDEAVNYDDFIYEGYVLLKYIGTDRDVIVPNKFSVISTGCFIENGVSLIDSLTLSPNIATIQEGALLLNEIESIDTTYSDYFTTDNHILYSSNHSVIYGTLKNFSGTTLQTHENTTSISKYAFQNSDITEVILNDGLQQINEYAFSNSKIETLVLPDTVWFIGEGAFEYNNISTLTLSENLDLIGSKSFQGNNIEELVIPDFVITIGYDAFINNPIHTLTFGESLSTFWGLAFDWYQVTNFTLSESNPNFEYENDFLTNESGDTIWAYLGNETDVVIPNNIETITFGAFKDKGIETVELSRTLKTIDMMAFFNNNITSLDIPTSVTRVGDSAFALNEITELVLTTPEIGPYAFSTNKLTSLIVTDQVEIIGDNAFAWNFDLFDYDLPEQFENDIERLGLENE